MRTTPSATAATPSDTHVVRETRTVPPLQKKGNWGNIEKYSRATLHKLKIQLKYHNPQNNPQPP